jgi:conjugal transfer pilus assembly protein TraV
MTFKNTNFLQLSLGCLSLITLLSLVGCTGMQSEFGCNAKAPDTCTPVGDVNRKAMRGDYWEERDDSEEVNAINTVHETNNEKSKRFAFAYPVSAPYAGEPIRYGETVQRIWIAPYEDSNGNYHEPSFVYTVLKGSHWIGLPIDEIIQPHPIA